MSETVEFQNKKTADHYREEYPEYLCSDDDARLKTVEFSSDVPDRILSEARAAAAEETAQDRETVPPQDLDESERQGIDFSADGMNVPKARHFKATAVKHGVGNWVHFANEHPTMGRMDFEDLMATVAEDQQETGSNVHERGTSAEAQAREEKERARSMQRQLGEQCDHARGHCKHGDPEACEFLQEACDFDEEEVEHLLSSGEDVDGAEEITGKTKGALKKSWQGYHGATSALDDALEEFQEEWKNAQQAVRAINGIREDHGQEPLHFGNLEEVHGDVQDFVREMAADCVECHASHDGHDYPEATDEEARIDLSEDVSA